MNLSHALALSLLPAFCAAAQEATSSPVSQAGTSAPDDARPSPELLDLEKNLTQKQADKTAGRMTPEQYQDFVKQFRPMLEETAARVAPTPLNQSLHSRILLRLGNSGDALANLNASLKKNPEDPELLSAKSFILYDQKDFAGSSAAANAALQKDPNNQDALWLKHLSEERSPPSFKIPGSPWDMSASAEAGVQGLGRAASDDSGKPYVLPVKAGKSAAPPSPNLDAAAPAPSGHDAPLVPLAATGVALWIAAGLAARQSQDNATAAVQLGTESVLDKTASGVQRCKQAIEDHPYIAGTCVVGGLALGGWLAAPFIVGGGGPSLLAIGAAGGSVPVAGAVTATSAAPMTTAAIGATIALAVGGDAPNSSSIANSDQKKRTLSDKEIAELEAEANSPDPADKGGKLTKAGRNLAKHSPREGSGLPEAIGSQEQINQQAARVVREILSDVGQVERHPNKNWGDVVDIIGKKGIGVRFTASGKFLYFLD